MSTEKPIDMNTSTFLESLRQELMCPGCGELGWMLSPCSHIICKICLDNKKEITKREHVGKGLYQNNIVPYNIDCIKCRKPGPLMDYKVLFFARNMIESLNTFYKNRTLADIPIPAVTSLSDKETKQLQYLNQRRLERSRNEVNSTSTDHSKSAEDPSRHTDNANDAQPLESTLSIIPGENVDSNQIVPPQRGIKRLLFLSESEDADVEADASEDVTIEYANSIESEIFGNESNASEEVAINSNIFEIVNGGTENTTTLIFETPNESETSEINNVTNESHDDVGTITEGHQFTDAFAHESTPTNENYRVFTEEDLNLLCDICHEGALLYNNEIKCMTLDCSNFLSGHMDIQDNTANDWSMDMTKGISMHFINTLNQPELIYHGNITTSHQKSNDNVRSKGRKKGVMQSKKKKIRNAYNSANEDNFDSKVNKAIDYAKKEISDDNFNQFKNVAVSKQARPTIQGLEKLDIQGMELRFSRCKLGYECPPCITYKNNFERGIGIENVEPCIIWGLIEEEKRETSINASMYDGLKTFHVPSTVLKQSIA